MCIRDRLKEVWEKREATYLTAPVLAARALHPGMARKARGGFVDSTTGWLESHLWQRAQAPAHACLRNAVHGDNAAANQRRADLAEALDEHFGGRGLFKHLETPGPDADIPTCAQWWRARQPSLLLRDHALRALSQRISTGLAERQWATLGRQCTPLRSRLTAPTKAKLVSLLYDGELLWRERPRATSELHGSKK